MRKINTYDFSRATRTTPWEINRQIVLNLVREHQPISRADLARRMGVGRGIVTVLVNRLLAEGTIFEGETGEAPRGRKPTHLYIRTHDRYLVAADVRFSRTFLMLSDFAGRPIAQESFPTLFSPGALVEELASRVRRLLREEGVDACEGMGVVMPGMVDRRTGRVLNSPQLGWREVEVRDALEMATGLPVHVENAPIACALAQVWLGPRGNDGVDSFVYVTVSDGVGAGVVVQGEVMRGYADTAGEFGHNPLNLNGPRCLCGLQGCWEAYTSNLATLARYLELDLSEVETRTRIRESALTVSDLVVQARSGDERARETIEQTGRYLGIGLAGIINAVNPARIILGGEITGAWDLVSAAIRRAAAERTLTPAAAATPIVADPAGGFTRLRGAAALVIAPNFAAPRVA